jgi:hypothetical protein
MTLLRARKWVTPQREWVGQVGKEMRRALAFDPLKSGKADYRFGDAIDLS